MKEIKWRIIIVFAIYAILCLMLSSCSITKETIVTTNNYIQEDFDYDCLENNKTFSEIILCYQAQIKAEQLQNDITNKLILENQ